VTAVFRLGDRGSTAAQIRALLHQQGRLPEGPGDEIDRPTERAIRAFQQSRGLSVDGIVGPETWRALQEASMRLGDRLLMRSVNHPVTGDDVRELQERLSAMGFDVGRHDGVFGERTELALASFQREIGLNSDGQCGPKTLRVLVGFFDKHIRGGNPHELREAEAVRRGAPTLAGRTVVIDPSHGGEDQGACRPDGTCERDIVWDIASRLEGRLLAAGANPVLTRGQHTNPSQAARAELANATGAAVAISLHCEEGSGEGASTFYFGHRAPSRIGSLLADLCQRELVARTDLLDGRTHAMTWEFLRLTRMPAVRVFVGHLAHPGDAHKLSQPALRDTVAEALLVAVQRLVLPEELDPPTGQLRLPAGPFAPVSAYTR
jgi:N-acetylmuramoyl-L-alanine amidase